MPETVKYTFDQAFDGGAKSRYDLEVTELRQQIDIARREGFEKGLEAGREEIRNTIEAQMKDFFGSMAVQIGQFEKDLTATKLELQKDFTQLAFALSNKLSHGLLETNPGVGIEALCKDAIDSLIDCPTLILKISDSFDDDFVSSLIDIASSNGYRGELTIERDQRLTPPDCQLVWAKGEAVLTQDHLEKEVTELVSAYLDRLTPQGETEHV